MSSASNPMTPKPSTAADTKATAKPVTLADLKTALDEKFVIRVGDKGDGNVPILTNPRLLAEIYRQEAENKSIEDIKFFYALYKELACLNTSDTEVKRSAINGIVEMYIKEGSESQVNIKSDTRKAILDNLKYNKYDEGAVLLGLILAIDNLQTNSHSIKYRYFDITSADSEQEERFLRRKKLLDAYHADSFNDFAASKLNSEPLLIIKPTAELYLKTYFDDVPNKFESIYKNHVRILATSAKLLNPEKDKAEVELDAKKLDSYKRLKTVIDNVVAFLTSEGFVDTPPNYSKIAAYVHMFRQLQNIKPEQLLNDPDKVINEIVALANESFYIAEGNILSGRGASTDKFFVSIRKVMDAGKVPELSADNKSVLNNVRTSVKDVLVHEPDFSKTTKATVTATAVSTSTKDFKEKVTATPPTASAVAVKDSKTKTPEQVQYDLFKKLDLLIAVYEDHLHDNIEDDLKKSFNTSQEKPITFEEVITNPGQTRDDKRISDTDKDATKFKERCGKLRIVQEIKKAVAESKASNEALTTKISKIRTVITSNEHDLGKKLGFKSTVAGAVLANNLKDALTAAETPSVSQGLGKDTKTAAVVSGSPATTTGALFVRPSTDLKATAGALTLAELEKKLGNESKEMEENIRKYTNDIRVLTDTTGKEYPLAAQLSAIMNQANEIFPVLHGMNPWDRGTDFNREKRRGKIDVLMKTSGYEAEKIKLDRQAQSLNRQLQHESEKSAKLDKILRMIRDKKIEKLNSSWQALSAGINKLIIDYRNTLKAKLKDTFKTETDEKLYEMIRYPQGPINESRYNNKYDGVMNIFEKAKAVNQLEEEYAALGNLNKDPESLLDRWNSIDKTLKEVTPELEKRFSFLSSDSGGEALVKGCRKILNEASKKITKASADLEAEILQSVDRDVTAYYNPPSSAAPTFDY